MTGFQLGFGLATLVQDLVDGSTDLLQFSTKEENTRQREDQFNEAAFLAGSILPKRRALIVRYATLALAKEFSDLKSGTESDHDDGFPNDLNQGLGTVALRIAALCAKITSADCDGKTLALLDEDLAVHARITESYYNIFAKKAHECSLLS